MLIVARDPSHRLLAGCRFSYGGAESLATTRAGTTELELPLGHSPGQSIKIYLLSGCGNNDKWFLINATVNIPIPGLPVELVVMNRSEILRMASEVSGNVPIVGFDSGDRLALRKKKQEMAKHYGLESEGQLDLAIKSFEQSGLGPQDLGIAKYLAGHYESAEVLLEESAKKGGESLVETYRYLGASQFERAKFGSAVDSFHKAIRIDGEDPVLQRWLALCFSALARWSEAETLLRRLLATSEASFEKQGPGLATDLSNLAGLLHQTNRTREAEPLLRRALALNEARLGKKHVDVARDLNNLTVILLATSQFDEAEIMIKRSLAIRENNCGKHHPDVASSLNCQAALLHETNRIAEAEPLLIRALAIDEGVYGSEHPNVARDLHNLAHIYLSTGRFAEAEPAMLRALAIDEKTFGKNHPILAKVLINLAQLYVKTNRSAEAEALLRRGLEISEASFGPEHPDVATGLNNLGELLRSTGRYLEAELFFRRALAIDEASLGPDHPHVAVRLSNLASVFMDTCRQDEAEPLFRRAISIQEASLGPDHPDVAITLNNLAQLLLSTGRVDGVGPLMHRATKILRDFSKSTGFEHPELPRIMENNECFARSLLAPQCIDWNFPLSKQR